MLVYVIKAELREDYKIYIEFNDGLSGIIDFKDKITTDHREIIRELVDKNKFNEPPRGKLEPEVRRGIKPDFRISSCC
jgi:hypothetical protein